MKKRILIIASRSVFKDYRVLKSIHNMYKFTNDIRVVELLSSKEKVVKNETIFDLKFSYVRPIIIFKNSIKKKYTLVNKLLNNKKNKFFE